MSHIYQNYAKKICHILHKFDDHIQPLDPKLIERTTVEPTKDSTHGQMATNVAMVVARYYSMSPLQLAEKLVPHISQLEGVAWAKVAAPGFINIQLTAEVWNRELQRILTNELNKVLFNYGQGHKVNIEYVSNNPTGPMHVGHCRGAVVGDVLANILIATGYDVTKEFYINDAGNQIDHLAHALYQRYRQILGHELNSDILYKGAYIAQAAQVLVDQVGDKYIDQPDSIWMEPLKSFAINYMMNLIKFDLKSLNIYHDVFTSEATLHKENAIETAVDQLAQQQLIYSGVLEQPKGKEIDDWEPREQLLFKATQFGDDVDRPLQKSDTTWTYFASDIAYHYKKYQSGAKTLINILGADHSGYVKRLTAAVRAVTNAQIDLKCVIVQMVKFIENGQSLKMSKRAGNFVTVNQAIEKVGLDALRFIMLTRKADTPLDFDFDKVVEQTKENPVFYAQYAYARCFSVKRHIMQLFPELDLSDRGLGQLDLTALVHDSYLPLIQKLVQWPRVLEQAGQMYEPHRITYYILELASLFHTIWTQGRDNYALKFIVQEDAQKTQLHFALIQALVKVMQQSFAVLGIVPPEEM